MGKEETLLNIEKTLESLGQVDISGVRLEDAGYELLDITKLSADIHSAIQSPAIAYYGALKKEALRNLNSTKNYYDRFCKKNYAKAKEELTSQGGKATVADIEARVIIDNESQINEWEERIAEAQKEYDTLDSWFEAWRQKSFSLKDLTGTEEEEKFYSSGSVGVPSVMTTHEQRIQNVRNLIRRKHEVQGQTSQG